MATSLAQVFSEARSLVTKLHDRERAADGMVGQAHTLNEKISCMKEYKEDLHELNDVAHQKPRTALVHSLQQENRQIRLLQEENRQLKLALEDHQAALELIMQRYRHQMLRFMQLTKIQGLAERAVGSECSEAECGEGVRKCHEFGRVFDSCLKLGEEASHTDQMEIARLRTENLGLRKIIDAAGKNEVWAKQASVLQAFVKAAAEDYFSASADAKKKREELFREQDENRTPTADRSPEETEPSNSLPDEEKNADSSKPPKTSKSLSTTETKKRNSLKSAAKSQSVGPAAPKTGPKASAGNKPVAPKAPIKSSKTNGNNNVSSVGNSNAASGAAKKSPAPKSVSGAMKRSSSLGTGNNPVSSDPPDLAGSPKANSPKRTTPSPANTSTKQSSLVK